MEREGDGSPSLPMLFCLETEDRKILGTGRATLLQKPGFLNYCRWRGCLPTRNTITSAGIQQPAKALMFGGMFIPASPSILTHCELEWLLSALLRWVPRHFSHKKKFLQLYLISCLHAFIYFPGIYGFIWVRNYAALLSGLDHLPPRPGASLKHFACVSAHILLNTWGKVSCFGGEDLFRGPQVLVLRLRS